MILVIFSVMRIQHPAKLYPCPAGEGELLDYPIFYGIFVNTYFVGCCLLKMKIFILKIRRMLTLFIAREQERDLNCQSRSQIAYCTHLLIHSVSWTVPILKYTATSVIFRNYLYCSDVFEDQWFFSEYVEKGWKVKLQEAQHSLKERRTLHSREVQN